MNNCYRNALNICIVSLCIVYCITNTCGSTVNNVLSSTLTSAPVFTKNPVPANSESESHHISSHSSMEISHNGSERIAQYSAPKRSDSSSVNDLFDTSSDHQLSIKPRKGVNASAENDPSDGTDPKASQKCTCCPLLQEFKEGDCQVCCAEKEQKYATTKLNFTLSRNDSQNIDATRSRSTEYGISNVKNVATEIVTHSTSEMPKTKPEFTRDDSFLADELADISDVPPESKYIIPIVAVILTAPLLIVLFMFLYKKSIEFWERRHYRRMDFLIDGMYND